MTPGVSSSPGSRDHQGRRDQMLEQRRRMATYMRAPPEIQAKNNYDKRSAVGGRRTTWRSPLPSAMSPESISSTTVGATIQGHGHVADFCDLEPKWRRLRWTGRSAPHPGGCRRHSHVAWTSLCTDPNFRRRQLTPPQAARFLILDRVTRQSPKPGHCHARGGAWLAC